MASMVDNKYKVFLFSATGYVYEFEMTLAHFDRFRRVMFEGYSEILRNEYVSIEVEKSKSKLRKKYKKMISNHLIYVDEEGLCKGLPENDLIAYLNDEPIRGNVITCEKVKKSDIPASTISRIKAELKVKYKNLKKLLSNDDDYGELKAELKKEIKNQLEEELEKHYNVNDDSEAD